MRFEVSIRSSFLTKFVLMHVKHSSSKANIFHILFQATSIRDTPDILQFEPIKDIDYPITVTCLISCGKISPMQADKLKAVIAPCVSPKCRGVLK